MKIIQTFWSGGLSLRENAFGWLHPEYNLMSWALSCLTLRRHGYEVSLYTDQMGKEWLINRIGLPYTEVFPIYNESLCLPKHWACAKIKTYSLQQEPFIHIDGDVFIPKKLPDVFENAKLITQNREYGANHYRIMMDNFVNHPNAVVPVYLFKRWNATSIPSYNMGVFGGRDLEFIHYYCCQAEKLLLMNHINDRFDSRSHLDMNVIFEQMLFAALADEKGRKPKSILPQNIKDTGYSASEFCDFCRWNRLQLLHIIGGNKRVESICQAMERKLFLDYPEYYIRIASLFPERHACIGSEYENEVVKQERRYCMSQTFFADDLRKWDNLVLAKNPFLTHLTYACMREKWVYYIPSVLSKNGHCMSVGPLGKNILTLLEDEFMTYESLCSALKSVVFSSCEGQTQDWIDEELGYLLQHGAITINNINP